MKTIIGLQVKPSLGIRFTDTSCNGSFVNTSTKSICFLHVKAVDRSPALRADSSGNGSLSTVSTNGLRLDSDLSDGHSGKMQTSLSTVGNSTNLKWHECSVTNVDREKLLNQKGCVVWITGLSGSASYAAVKIVGKSTVACALNQLLHRRGKLCYVLDGDNLRHGLNRDLTFKAEDRAENIRRVGEVAKLFADAGFICIASLISPYKKDRDACRALLLDGAFIEVFMDVPLEVCENRDPKGLYKRAREGKIKGFTGIDDPYEAPLNCEIALKCNTGDCASPLDMAEKVIAYLEAKNYLEARNNPSKNSVDS